MPRFTPESLAAWTAGTWTARPAEPITRILHDSRTLEPGALFVAIPGEHFDGHAFLPAAPALGAVAALCQRGRAHPALPCLEVPDTVAALRDIARGHRATLGGLMIGITGSAGKTTTKEMLAAMLARRACVCRTRGNWNNDIGLPLSLLRMDPEDDFGVFELGMNRPGEIAALASLLQPVCGMITNIGEAHLENFGSVAAIAREKASLLESLPAEGLALIDNDSPWRDLFRSLTRARVVTCAIDHDADHRGFWNGAELEIEDRLRGCRYRVVPPLPGPHMVRNTLLCAAVARECGLTPAEIREGLEDFAPQPMRWEHRTVGGWRVINDAYNANPLSMRAALQTLAEMEAPGGRWAVLGGMSELGADEEALHRELGAFLADKGLAGCVAVGPKGRWYAAGAAPFPVYCAETLAQAAAHLREHAREGAVILLKASRSEGLERLLSHLEPHSRFTPT